MSSGFSDSPVGQAPPWARITAKIVHWRNWRLAIKLAAVVLVPAVFALALGVLQIHDQIGKANEFSRLDHVVTAASTVHSTATLLQEERTRAAEFLSAGPVPVETLEEHFTATDRAIADSRSVLDDEAFLTAAAGSAREDAERSLARLPTIRQYLVASAQSPSRAINAYNQIVESLLGLDRALIGEITSPELQRIAATRHELARIGSEMRLQQAWVLVGLLRSEFTPQSVTELGASETRRVAYAEGFRAAASEKLRTEYDRLYAEPAFPERENSLRIALASEAEGVRTPRTVSSHQWEGQSQAALAAIRGLQQGLDSQLHRTAFQLQDNASNLAGLESVILLSALLVAGTTTVLVARQLLGSLDALRRSALDTANARLPRTVAEVRTGSSTRPAIERVPVETTEEFGQLARAFDAVQKQAINLAAEQAQLRRSYSDSFVNVSRRSQSLLERQLRLFEQLERDEEDPDQLATLFQLDHLATRMRRNNENLMVLSGTDLTRRFTRPATPADLIRAAISEIEHYPRVVVQPLPDVRIVGYVANDLVRLLAELLDNAANFSAPHTTVAVSGIRYDDGSVGIDIVDHGIGMSEEELTSANDRLADDGEIDISTSRRMGLFVVGRLANRHGISVRLSKGTGDTGVRVTVSLRADLILEVAKSTAAPVSYRPVAAPEADRRLTDTVVENVDRAAVEGGLETPPLPSRNGRRVFGSTTRQRTEAPLTQQNQAHREVVDDEAGMHTAPTPIFDHLASAWFQASQPRHGPASEEGVRWPSHSVDDSKGTSQVAGGFPSYEPHLPAQRGSEDQGSRPTWAFRNDMVSRQAHEASTSEPTDYTSAGLPIRIPQARLVAGSANQGESLPNGRSHRDPSTARDRLARFQQGLRTGRHSYREQENQPKEAALPFTEEVNWRLRADIQSEQAEAALNRAPDEYTAAGLPKRTPHAQLAPGAAAEPSAEGPQRRNADLMRGRLSSFQRGVREGKHSLREPTEESTEKR